MASMNSRLLVLLVCFAVYQLACTNGSTTPAEAPLAKTKVEGETIALAETEKMEEKQVEMTALKAKRLASTHLALRQTSWGKPTAISEDEVNFYLSYETPKRELRILGERMLTVEKSTDIVRVRKRR